MAAVVSYIAILMCVSACTWASNPVPIPSRPHGLTYQSSQFWEYANPLKLEVFHEVACSDAKVAFPVYIEVANQYRGMVNLVFYQFPLPYHRAAMHGSQTQRIISEVAPENEFCYLERAFQYQDRILDANIVNKTETELVSIFADFAEHCGVRPDVFYSLIREKFGNKEARAEWKYGCSRGVSGTPFVFLNGVFLTNNQDWTLANFTEVIEDLLNPDDE